MSKVFNDPIHGHIDLSPVDISIIDKPQFQRLVSETIAASVGVPVLTLIKFEIIEGVEAAWCD